MDNKNQKEKVAQVTGLELNQLEAHQGNSYSYRFTCNPEFNAPPDRRLAAAREIAREKGTEIERRAREQNCTIQILSSRARKQYRNSNYVVTVDFRFTEDAPRAAAASA